MGIMTAFVLLVTLIGKLGSADPAGVGKSLAILGVSMLSLSISMSILVDRKWNLSIWIKWERALLF